MSILDGFAQMVSGSTPDMDRLVRERQRDEWFRLLQRSTVSAAVVQRLNTLNDYVMRGQSAASLSATPHSPPDIDPLGR